MLRARRSSEFVGSDISFSFLLYLSFFSFLFSIIGYVDWVEFPGLVGGWEMDGSSCLPD